MKIEQVMSRPVAVCRATDALNTPAQLMWEHDCGCVPVVDEAGKPVAMITDRDVCMAAYTRGKPLSEISVADAMSREVFTCSTEDPLELGQTIMRRNQVRRLPVTDPSGVVVGVVSLNDIAIEAGRERGQRNKTVTAGDVALTLRSICEHRHADIATVGTQA